MAHRDDTVMRKNKYLPWRKLEGWVSAMCIKQTKRSPARDKYREGISWMDMAGWGELSSSRRASVNPSFDFTTKRSIGLDNRAIDDIFRFSSPGGRCKVQQCRIWLTLGRLCMCSMYVLHISSPILFFVP
ncbi:uncharacterized protein BDCG_00954 [Blastomyces dermatitidis ER-3]|uniref:Uncharacterized protein n=1 Tax=Ajellomyces dermatitidis (strain ER-3 / ATCC MYA-2586) TaxID=559297 RepID=A0ABP2ELK9_AJEDR|nr:uncharacterized protein BDCG_00954 [Blastomyces dermatitidis ER-3]EEQ84149.2 hypothetical protein BDCG_00954 [Blastomyces dermatitidis ER-3]